MKKKNRWSNVEFLFFKNTNPKYDSNEELLEKENEKKTKKQKQTLTFDEI